MQDMAWDAIYDVQCIWVLRKGKDECGTNLANQACHCIDSDISVEIDMKITGNGYTVCKWQAKQEQCKTALNSIIAFKMHHENMLQHSNIKKYDSEVQVKLYK